MHSYKYIPIHYKAQVIIAGLVFKGNTNDNLWKANTTIQKGDGSGGFSSFRIMKMILLTYEINLRQQME